MLTAGSAPRLSGGSLYQRRIAEHANASGARVTIHGFRSARLRSQRSEAQQLFLRAGADADVLVIDSIVAAAVAGLVDASPAPVMGLAHQRLGGVRSSELGFALDLRAYREMAGVIATGPAVASELEMVGVPGVALVEPGTDPPPEIDDPPDLRRGRSIAIVCVANWLPGKGIAELLEACRGLPRAAATIHLVGDPHAAPRYGRAIARLVRHPALRGRVEVHGSLEHHAVTRLLAGADVFALPSEEESYGMAWSEALAAGLPVVGWKASNLPNLVTDGAEGILVEPGDVAGLTSALGTLAVDAGLRRRLSEGARRRATAFTTWEETATRFVNVVRSRVDQVAAP
jgi:glycosyltransferase involved in cell wall biosynthesis